MHPKGLTVPLALAALALLVTSFLPFAMAQAAPTIDEFRLPNASTGIDAMCTDSQGDVWLAQSSPAVLWQFHAATGAFIRHEVPADGDVLFKGMSAEGSDYIWMADQGGQKIYGYDVQKNKFYNFTFPKGLKLDPSGVIAQDHYLWIACNMELGRLDMDTNFLKDYYVDKYTADLADLAADRLGNVWFVEYSSGKLGAYYRMNDQVVLYPMPAADAAPTCLGIDPQGKLWFIESGPNRLGSFDTNMNQFQEVDMPVLDGLQANPKRLAVDPDGGVWLTDMPHSRVIKYYPTKDVFAPISLGNKVYPTFIEADNNNIWILESGTNTLARLQADPLYGLVATPTPTPTPVPTQNATPTPKPTPGFEILTALIAIVFVTVKIRK